MVIVMAKAPRLLHGKSRLAQGVGAAEALRINRFLHARTLRIATDPRWRLIWAVAPDEALHWRLPGIWPARAMRRRQGGGDLGARLTRAMRAAGAAPLALIGTDCPTLTPRRIAEALDAARRDGVHAIPAEDGGFVALAARSARCLSGAFTDVRWSSAHTLNDVCSNLAKAGYRISTSAALPDIDAVADWAAFLATKRSCAR